jgi:uncharacterized protein (TIGR02246 family)
MRKLCSLENNESDRLETRRTEMKVICLLLVFAACISAQAQSKQSSNEALIRRVVLDQENAWNRGDAKAYCAHFQEDSISTIIMGTVFHGRSALQERVAAIFATVFKNSVLTHKIQTIRFVRPDVAVVDITTEMAGYRALPPGVKASTDGKLRTSMLQVMVKQHGAWWVNAFHNVDVKTP